MKTYTNFIIIICIAVLLLSGMDGCQNEEDPVAFVKASPADGSTIQTDTEIIVTFDGTPTGLNVKGGKFSLTGVNATITGPFTEGTLTLALTWADSATVLTYTVAAPEPEKPDIPPAPEDMVLIPAGEFQIGSNDAEARNNEQPVRTVYVDAFYMDETEVTNVQFKEFLLENPSWQKGRIEARFHDGDYLKHWNGNNYPNGKGNHPVRYVSWYAAMAYSEWTGKRLPTEAEWERAARGGLAGKKYPNGNMITPRDANYDKNVGDTTPVGRYPANGYGLYDMVGNVWEWCLDEYDEDFYFTFPRNGVARNPLSGANSIEWIMDNFTNVNRSSAHVYRGGSWYQGEPYARVAYRNASSPTNTGFRVGIGFRCVKDVTR
ncbi:hypothetical protein C6501_01605 [Candidatus Poribacteria bacterium]|nr:MAG: hypothetical protein C6501_01605 [Candidatus Poribacteria bacterium]